MSADHDPFCPNAAGDCCPWVAGGCCCQCDCDRLGHHRADAIRECVAAVESAGWGEEIYEVSEMYDAAISALRALLPDEGQA